MHNYTSEQWQIALQLSRRLHDLTVGWRSEEDEERAAPELQPLWEKLFATGCTLTEAWDLLDKARQDWEDADWDEACL